MVWVTSIIAYLASFLTSAGQLISVESLKFIAFRSLLMFALFIALPVILYNVFTDIIFDFLDYGFLFITGQGISPISIDFMGMGAYIASKIQLVQCFSVYMSFVGIRFIMRFIPFFN